MNFQDSIEHFVEILRLTTQVSHVEIFSKELIQIYKDSSSTLLNELSHKQKRKIRRKLESFHVDV